MRFKYSKHALEEMRRREIPLDVVERILENADQVVPAKGQLKVYQSKTLFGGKPFLVRIVVDDIANPPTVVTAYRTSKIGKYWRSP